VFDLGCLRSADCPLFLGYNSISGNWWLFYWWLLVLILLVAISVNFIGGYFIGGY